MTGLRFQMVIFHNFGRFLRTFQSLEEAKAYAMYYANVNSGGINKKTILKQEEESRIEDHVNRIAHYEAYQMYRKYYKEILDAISEENCFPDSCSGGGVYLREAILKKVPEITEEQLRMIWRELPFVIEKRTQDWIEREKQFSENYNPKGQKAETRENEKNRQIRSGNKGEVQYGILEFLECFDPLTEICVEDATEVVFEGRQKIFLKKRIRPISSFRLAQTTEMA